MSIEVTLKFSTIAEAVATLTMLSGTPVPAAIEYADRPDVGAEPVLPSLLALARSVPDIQANPFAAAPAAAPAFNPFAAATPPAPAPTPEVAAAPVPPSVDSTGLPWDARIHAANKATNQDGSWRQKRGLNDEVLKNRVEQELRAAMGAPAAVSAATATAGNAAPPALPPAPPAAIPPAPPVAASTPAPAAALPPAPPATTTAPASAGSAPTTFPALMARLAPEYGADAPGANARMAQALATVNLTSPAQLAARPDLIGQVWEMIEALKVAA